MAMPPHPHPHGLRQRPPASATVRAHDTTSSPPPGGTRWGRGARFDLLLLEVVEHVQDMPAFARSVLAHLAPGGLVLASTVNRSWRSFLLASVGAEWLLRLLPPGTHRRPDFVTPAELAAAMAAGGRCQQSLTGLRYTPVWHRAQWCRSTAVNYMASDASEPARAATLAGSTPMRPPERQRGSNNSGH
jgi:hypothetical protein